MKRSSLSAKLRSFFSCRPEIIVAYLFGSMASGRSHRFSDVDVAVLLDEKKVRDVYPYGYKAHLISDLMSLLKRNDIDVVVLNKSSYFLRHQIINGGKIVYERDVKKKILFEADMMSRYPDIKRLLSLHMG